MKRRLRNRGEDRPKAFIGALIGAAGSIVGSIINANAQKRQMEQQARAEAEAKAREAALQTTKALNLTQNAQDAYKEQFRQVFSKGGRRRLRNGIDIVRGGYGEPIDDDTILLRGRSHGKGGIDIDTYAYGGKPTNKFEAEGGEVMQLKPNEVRIFSNRLKLPNGLSFAKAATLGYNKDKLFALQQSINGNYGSRPVEKNRSKAEFGANFGTVDYIGLGTNILASILANSYSRRMYKDAEKYAPKKPSLYQAGKLITNYNINPQLSNWDYSKYQGYDTVDRDTSSSPASIDRRQKINNQTLLGKNELYNTKYSKEAELMNQDILNQQEVANRNVEAYNKWQDARQTYLGNLALSRSKSNVDMIQGIGSSIGNFLQQGIDNYQASQARSMMLATSQYGTAERASLAGVHFSNREMRNQLNDAIYRYNNPNASEKEKHDAQDSYNFWLNRLAKQGSKSYNKIINEYPLFT